MFPLTRVLVSILCAVSFVGTTRVTAQPIPEPANAVVPAQFQLQPANVGTGNLSATGRIAAGIPPMPPSPMVQIMVLVPQDIAPGQEILYTLKIVNSSAARADKVVVRMPIPSGVEPVPVKVEPKAKTREGVPNELFWDIGTLEPNGTKLIEVTFRPKADATDISARAHVSFEHGQLVKTAISVPKLKVKTEIPKQTSLDNPIPVRVTIRNEGRVAIDAVKLTETVTEGVAFHKDTTGEKGIKPEQRVWNVGTVRPGEIKTFDFRLMAKSRGDVRVLTAVDGKGSGQANDTAETKVEEAALKLDLKGDPKTSGDTLAAYEVTATNTGTMPLLNVRVSGSVPADCLPRRMTNGGQVYRDQVQWTIPKLAPGDRETFRWSLQTSASGRKTVRATAVSRGLEESANVETVFAGAAVLHWETSFDQPTVGIDRQGIYTVKVTNTGSEAASGARLVVDLPPKGAVSVVEVSPVNKRAGDQITFEPRTIAAGKSEIFSITFKGEQIGKAYFNAKLAAPALGEKPIGAEKYVEITRGR